MSWVDREIESILREYDRYVRNLERAYNLDSAERTYREFNRWLLNRVSRVKRARGKSEYYDEFATRVLRIATDAHTEFRNKVEFLADLLWQIYGDRLYDVL